MWHVRSASIYDSKTPMNMNNEDNRGQRSEEKGSQKN
jgi:hypothetical protein